MEVTFDCIGYDTFLLPFRSKARLAESCLDFWPAGANYYLLGCESVSDQVFAISVDPPVAGKILATWMF